MLYVFHSANLTLRTVTIIHNIQKINQTETRKQNESCSVTSRRMIQILKKKEIELINENV